MEITRDFNDDEYIYIEGECADDINPLLKDFPKFINIFTAIELKFLTEMYARKSPVQVHTLNQFSRGGLSNIVDVHLMSIRRKLKKYHLPFEVITYRGKGLRELIKK